MKKHNRDGNQDFLLRSNLGFPKDNSIMEKGIETRFKKEKLRITRKKKVNDEERNSSHKDIQRKKKKRLSQIKIKKSMPEQKKQKENESTTLAPSSFNDKAS